ncbi:peptidase M16 domain protein [Geobacter metallireducens RCH3]|uniref:Zinc-dependent peptidase, M16 family n=1 Tax=Geobacter metallireducens (strain ATCC 53774 / DSM 7210 / GS-15) TaxID=269799 RepID=Q39VA0_GEOMG|nr:pitrilysin family protein [Geobacter metallireducens]ABB31824.1 zinc-dependent peptidase, M16 family [Geobacter metallireducens GS-15]EHP89294.1 peptidase M16 domain protein [Geobacter metallireducens RCH3]
MVSKTILDNGVRVISEYMPHAHSVSIGIWVANGSRHERREHNGVAHFIEHLLFKGTVRRSALDIAREIDSVGGVLNAFTSREYVCYYAKVLDKNLPQAVDLLTDIFLNSTFDPEEIEKERKVVLQEISMLEDSPDDYVHDLFHRSFWRGHPLGMSILGSAESVSNLSRDAIVAHRDAMYRSEDIIVAVAGNVRHDELLKLISGSFDSVPEGTGRNCCHLPVYDQKLEIVEKDLEQLHICLGTKSLPHNHPRRFEAYLMNTILGGSMSSRLFQEIREHLGLAYTVYSYVVSHTDAGSLVVYAGTSPEKLSDVLEITCSELRRLKFEPVPATELEAAREQLKGNILLSLESSDNRMTKLAKNEIYFGRYLSLAELTGGFDSATADGIAELANDFFSGDYVTLALTGKISGQIPDLSHLVL